MSKSLERPHWNPRSHWDDHPDFPITGWLYEVENGDTRLGYIDWVNSQIEIVKETWT